MGYIRKYSVAGGAVAVVLVMVAAVFVAFRPVAAEEKCQETFKFLSAHVNCAQEAEQSARIAATEAKVSARVSAAQDSGDVVRAGVFYRDLNSRKWFGVNELEPFTPASLLKIPLVIAYYKLAEVDSSILDKPLSYTLHPDVGQPVDAHLQAGASYPVQTLIKQVLMHSDNDATLALSDNMRESYEEKVFYDLGVSVPGRDVDSLSPKTYGAIFRALYNASYLQAPYSEDMLMTMTQASFASGLVAGVPDGTTVAHKFGYRVKAGSEQELHDCGIVYHPDEPFILCIMTEGNDVERLKQTIADITRIIWDTL